MTMAAVDQVHPLMLMPMSMPSTLEYKLCKKNTGSKKSLKFGRRKKILAIKVEKKIATAIETCLVSEKMTDRSFLEMIPFNAIICYEIY